MPDTPGSGTKLDMVTKALTLLSLKRMSFELRETGYPTPNYVSVFICQ